MSRILSKITIKKITHSKEYQNTFFRFADSENWGPSFSDFDLYIDKAHTHAYVGYDGKKPVFSYMMSEYTKSDFIFGGIFYAIPEIRGKNLIYPIMMQKNLELILPFKNFGVIAVPKMGFKFQRAYGCNFYGKVYIRHFLFESSKNPTYNINRIKESFEVNLSELQSYDRETCGYDREHIVNKFAQRKKNFECLVYVDEKNAIRGYGVMRKAIFGEKIGPLLADDQEIATEILNALKSRIIGTNTKKIMTIVPEADGSKNQQRFWDLEGFDSEKNRFLYIQCMEKPKTLWNKAFSIFSCEVGF